MFHGQEKACPGFKVFRESLLGWLSNEFIFLNRITLV